MTEEHKIQNAIRNDLAGECLLFRANVGKAWTGEKIEKLPGNRLLITNPRPFDAGLPTGFGDLFGLVKVVITQEMVGKTIGQFIMPEVKTAKGKASDAQKRCINAVNDNGGRAGVVRSPSDARKLIFGG